MADLNGTNPDLASRIQALEAAVAQQGGHLGIESGFRTNAQQTALYAQEPGLAAKPGHSNHERGLAVDLNGSLDIAHRLAPSFGLVFPMSWEPWHIEMVGSSNPSAQTPQPAGTPAAPTADPADRVVSTLSHLLQGGVIPDAFDPASANATPAPMAPVGATGTPSSGTGGGKGVKFTGDITGFATSLLNQLGLPVTSENIKFMAAWQRAEGGSADNPFNTTQGAPGATNFNSVGVKRYGDIATGVNATAKTLRNGNYAGILAALAAGNNAKAAAQAVANSPWGTGAGVLRVLG